ncbi:DNA ligase [Clostridioides sp. ES-S-0049-02]|uniref:DNA ligase n=1 Tax=Clostridioides sp. ES-S-0049-02 TaxID=2770778 RepID=UPI001D1234A1|nr:DNA ligase [Clostridioides sp. ES-S-0049-02]
MKELLKIKNIFNNLIATSNRKEKIRILEENKNNGMFVECLQFLLDENISTGISKKKIFKMLNNTNYITLNNIYDMIDYLSENNSGRNIDIRTIQVFSSKNRELKDFIIKLATKNIKLGVSAKTVNKIMPYLIIEKNK